MATGLTAFLNAANLNSQAGELACRWRALAADTVAFHEAVVNLGHAGLMAAGFPDADATAYSTKADIINTIAAVYQGTAGQASPYNFDDALAEWCGTRSR